MTREQMIEKAKEICEATYQSAKECGELNLKKAEKAEVTAWISKAEAFAELFGISEDVFLGV